MQERQVKNLLQASRMVLVLVRKVSRVERMEEGEEGEREIKEAERVTRQAQAVEEVAEYQKSGFEPPGGQCVPEEGWYRTLLMERRNFSGSRETSCKGRLEGMGCYQGSCLVWRG